MQTVRQKTRRRAVSKPEPPASVPDRNTKPNVSSRLAVLVCAGLVALTWIVFATVRNHEFVEYDDQEYLSDNTHVTTGLTFDNVSWAFTTGYAANWHPLTWISHMVDVQLFGMSAGSHHLTSVVFHSLSTALLFLFLLQTTNRRWESAFVAACFAVHPLHVESVAWVAERKDVLSGFFWMSTLCTYAWYVRRPKANRYAAVLILFAFGLMSKPVLVTLPFALLLLDIWPLQRMTPGAGFIPRLRPMLVEKIPLFALAAASSFVTFLVQRFGGAVARLDQVPLSLRASNVPMSYAAYIRDMIWPARLAAFYPLPLSYSIVAVSGVVVLLIVLTVLAAMAVRQRPYITVGWFWYLGTLVPMIGLVQVGSQARADRYTYIPLIGLFVIVTWGISDLANRLQPLRRMVPFAAALVIALCSVLAHAQTAYWKDTATLWTRAVAVTTGNYPAHNSLGIMLQRQRRFDEAIAEYRESIRLSPAYAEPHYNLASVLAVTGHGDDAVAELEEAIRVRPNYSHAHNNLGFALLTQGKIDEAVAHLHRALEIEPTLHNSHYGLALVNERLGRFQEAIQECHEALRLKPDYKDAQQKLAQLTQRTGGGQ